MVKTGKSPSELLAHLYRKVGVHHYQRRDIEFPEKERETIIRHLKQNAPDDIGGVKVVRFDTTDGFRFLLADGAWLLIRFSGTEPVMRIYAEDGTPSRVGELLTVGRNLTGV